MAYIPKGITSIVSTVPSSVQVGASVMGHAPMVIVGGSVATASQPVSGSSVVQQGTSRTSVLSSTPSSMLVGASVFGRVGVEQVTNPWIITGSIQGGTAGNSSVQVLNFPTNQSVSGSVGIDGTPNVNTAGSVVAFQGTASNLKTSSSVVGHAPVVIVGGSVATATTNSSVQLLNSPNAIGSVATLQGTNPWQITANNNSVIGVIKGSIATAIVSGSVAVSTGNSSVQVLNFPSNQSVSGTVDIGSVTIGSVNQATTPWDIAGSVVSYPLGTIVTSLVSTVPSSVQVGASIIGVVPVTGSFAVESASVVQQGTWRTSVISSTPSSMLVGASVFGNIGISGVPNVNTAGSVVAFQGAGWSGSVASHIKSGSVIAVLGGNTSVVSSNPQSSIKSWNSPLSSWVSGTVDMRGNSGGSVELIAAQGANVTTYVTGLQAANYGPSSVLVTLAGDENGGSILAYTIAPAGGGSNIVYPNALKTGANTAFTASINAVSSVLLSAQGFTN